MTSETSPYPEAPPPPPAPRVSAAPATGWSGSDLVTGSSLVVLLIALFLPWFTPATAGAIDGPTSHGYLWAVFVLGIVALIALVTRDAIDRVPGNLPSSEQMLVGATGLALLLTILGIVQKPYPGNFLVDWTYGGFIALIAALVAFFAASGVAARLRARSPGTNA